MRFAGKVAFVTGGGSGMGRGTSIAFAREGATVVVADRVAPSAESVAQEITQAGGRAIPAVVDVAQYEQVRAAVEDAISRFGKVDIMVHCAGTVRVQPFVESTEKTRDIQVNVNLKGSFNCCHAVLKNMLDQRYGKIIMIASEDAKLGGPTRAVYSATKGGIISFTRALAKEVASSGINVNCILPGAIKTPGMEFASGPITPEQAAERGKGIYVGRLGLPEDIANTILFLCSDEASFITGQDLLVDGGGHRPNQG